jgi:hypothetical protein
MPGTSSWHRVFLLFYSGVPLSAAAKDTVGVVKFEEVKVKVKVVLQLMVSQSVCLDVEPLLVLLTRCLLLLTIIVVSLWGPTVIINSNKHLVMRTKRGLTSRHMEELLERRSSGLEIRKYGHRDCHADHVAPFIRKSWHQLRRQL